MDYPAIQYCRENGIQLIAEQIETPSWKNVPNYLDCCIFATRFLSRGTDSFGRIYELRKGLIMITKILRVIAMSAALWGGSVAADPGAKMLISGKLITDVCWSCIFPIKIAGVPISGPGGSYPDDSAKNPLCLCNDNLGESPTG